MASAAPGIQTIRNYDHSGTACSSISTTRGTTGYYKTQSPNSVTGMAFNGTDLLFSCWGDSTITAIRPSAGTTTYPKDTAVGANGIYTVAGLPVGVGGTPGIGSLDWDAQHNVLWACNLSAFDGSAKNQGADVGYITLSSDGSGSASFTDVATAPDGCVNGIDYNPATSTVSVTGALQNGSTTTIDQFVINSDLTAEPPTTWKPGKPLTPDGFVSGIEYTANGLLLADNHGGTKTLQYTSDFVTSTRLSSSNSRRYEDVACDSVTFAPKTVVWLEWFDHNQAEPFVVPDNDTCTVTAPPPLSVTQDQPDSVMADASLSYTVAVVNNGADPQTNVVLTDTPPPNTIFSSAAPSQGSCSTTLPVSCTLGDLAGNGSASVVVTVTPIKPGTYTNTANAVSDTDSSQPSTEDATANGEAGVSYVSVDDSGLSAATPSPAQGSIIQFDFFGTAATNHDLSDGIGLFDSGVQTPISYLRQELDAAAAYKITDNPSGHVRTINISTTVGPGPYTTSGFAVAWSSQPLPPGYDEDIQVQLPGSTTWSTWLSNQTGTSATYVPASGLGTYKFRARIQKTGATGSAYASAYSFALAVPVTSS